MFCMYYHTIQKQHFISGLTKLIPLSASSSDINTGSQSLLPKTKSIRDEHVGERGNRVAAGHASTSMKGGVQM